MKYISTRNSKKTFSFKDVFLNALAPDGGLFVPQNIPFFSIKELNELKKLSYNDLAAKIIIKFCSEEFEENELKEIVEKSYKSFRSKETVILKKYEDIYLLELFHGPTLAFKDVAMQLLGALLDHFAQKQDKKIAVLGATSGDTGAAAIAACSRYSNVEVFILYPHGRVTEVQRKQMTTSQANNVHALSIESDFDGCQALVKNMFLDKSLIEGDVKFIAANSINWTRCMTQSVYFFWSYLRLKDQFHELTFSIPSGNFGHAYAGWAAKEMGLPIKRLLIATNSNDVLHTLFSNNRYEKTEVNQTLAPSMDISVASNFERLLYNLYDNDSKKLAQVMEAFPKSPLSIPNKKWDSIKDFFSSFSSSNQEIIEQIRQTHFDSGYLLDPHTATGVRATNALAKENEPVITMATAHPSKFVEAIDKAIPGLNIDRPIQLEASENREEVYTLLPDNLDAVKSHILSTLR